MKLEDPKSAEGQEFLEAVETTKRQIGYVGSSWGRTLEDENLLVWAIGSLTNLSVEYAFEGRKGIELEFD